MPRISFTTSVAWSEPSLPDYAQYAAFSALGTDPGIRRLGIEASIAGALSPVTGFFQVRAKTVTIPSKRNIDP